MYRVSLRPFHQLVFSKLRLKVQSCEVCKKKKSGAGGILTIVVFPQLLLQIGNKISLERRVLRSWVQLPPRSIFINLGNYGVKLRLFLVILGQNQQQCQCCILLLLLLLFSFHWQPYYISTYTLRNNWLSLKNIASITQVLSRTN